MAASRAVPRHRRRAAAKPAPPPASAPQRPRRFAAMGLYGYIWQTSGRAQSLLALLSVFIFLLDLVPLELQRRIVNDAIGKKLFTELIWLCAIYALTALVQGLAKLTWNVYRNSVGEATSRRLRLETFGAALRHPEPDTTAKEGVGISIIMSEADPVGLFVATSVSEPVLHGGVLVSVFAYLIYLQPWMALVALALFVPQCLVVPIVQNAINRRTEARIQVMRRLSGDIVAETAEGVLERESRGYRQRVGNIYALNMQIYRRKYAMNCLINLLYHLGTVGILFVGGWFVMQGKTEVGTVVAFISGLTKVNDPWNDLVTFFRDMTNARVKYQLIAKVLDDQDPSEAAEPPAR
ncbi:MAG TPA: ABC transporter ATP-binding protein [Stellaceae bacterium]|jgi:ABC-type bacteriocin/lantibiotic exporter with double-glycine peptidase domain|nr:ABC transporter ATP-binding protein [Stellaceae bacterium]